jgi:hypothetical protein
MPSPPRDHGDRTPDSTLPPGPHIPHIRTSARAAMYALGARQSPSAPGYRPQPASEAELPRPPAPAGCIGVFATPDWIVCSLGRLSWGRTCKRKATGREVVVKLKQTNICRFDGALQRRKGSWRRLVRGGGLFPRVMSAVFVNDPRDRRRLLRVRGRAVLNAQATGHV